MADDCRNTTIPRVPIANAVVAQTGESTAGDPLAGVVEISPNKRYIRFDDTVAQTINGIQSSYKAFDTKNGIEVEWHHINLNALEEDEQSRVVQVMLPWFTAVLLREVFLNSFPLHPVSYRSSPIHSV